ncbi:MAG: rhodanese-like domain-containing protein, partial [Methanotrichaceae archaeon]|nr:rhodanese-like domain-containing protein [Methanotrichaceae archaeon]
SEMCIRDRFLIVSTSAKCPVSGCGGGGNWEASAQAFLNSDVPLVGANQIDQAKNSSFKAGDEVENETQNGTGEIGTPKAQTDYVQPVSRSGIFMNGDLLKSLAAVSSSELVLDVSNTYAPGEAHIRGAIHIPSKSFLYENGTLRPVSEIAKILGDAGVSRDDSIVVYSDSFQSGEATFVLWLLRYLGHEDVKALDGGLDDWTAASLPLETEQNRRNATNYTPILKPELLADYEYVKSGTPQTVDVRTFQEFGKGRIPQAYFIGTDSVLAGGKVKAGDQLNDTFAKLDSDRQTVVYSTDFFNSSLVWYALQLMGFDSRLYSWQDWQEHRQEEVYEIGLDRRAKTEG